MPTRAVLQCKGCRDIEREWTVIVICENETQIEERLDFVTFAIESRMIKEEQNIGMN